MIIAKKSTWHDRHQDQLLRTLVRYPPGTTHVSKHQKCFIKCIMNERIKDRCPVQKSSDSIRIIEFQWFKLKFCKIYRTETDEYNYCISASPFQTIKESCALINILIEVGNLHEYRLKIHLWRLDRLGFVFLTKRNNDSKSYFSK